MSLPEDLSREELEAVQLERFTVLVQDVLSGNAFWKKRFEESGWGSAVDVTTRLDGLRLLSEFPVCSKQDFVADQDENPPYGTNLSEPLSGYTRLHQTSGTTGRPLRWLDTPAAWRNLLDAWSQMFRIAGVTAEDRFAFPFSFGPFIGFWAAFEGAVESGHLCLPGGGMSSGARLRLIEDNQATVLCCTPTYALRLAEVAREEAVDLASGSVRMLIVAGEPGGSVPGVREEIESAWGARVIDHWGMTELGPIAVECVEGPGGMHVLEGECVAEIVDPDTLEKVPPGEQGELLVTTLRRTGSPVLRYRTGDLVVADSEPCPCGRALLRLKGGILGRADDMLTVRGNNVFPSSIEAVIRRVSGVAEFRVVIGSESALDRFSVEIEPVAGAAVDEVLAGVEAGIRETFNFQAEVSAVGPGQLPRFELKGRRFVRK
ncbi:MAG TPA: CoF synthetase [Planctomycetaceae bacterium]|nr:CoF synthetase [Planctomycetaceae bacterium]HCD02680.1 CoF synthetase [Planctomycetaceae bacterium]